MRSMLKLIAEENFKGQDFTGEQSFDMKAYTILGISPFEVYGLDAEMKKTKTALHVTIRNNDSGVKKIFYCSSVKIDNV